MSDRKKTKDRQRDYMMGDGLTARFLVMRPSSRIEEEKGGRWLAIEDS